MIIQTKKGMVSYMIYRFNPDMRNDIPYDDSYDMVPDENFSESYGAGVDYAEQLENSTSYYRGRYTGKASYSTLGNREKFRRTADAVNAFASTGRDTDVLGSYTGIPNGLNGDSDKIHEIPDPKKGIDRKVADGKIYMNVQNRRDKYDTHTLSPYEYHSDAKDYDTPVQDADDL